MNVELAPPSAPTSAAWNGIKISAAPKLTADAIETVLWPSTNIEVVHSEVMINAQNSNSAVASGAGALSVPITVNRLIVPIAI